MAHPSEASPVQNGEVDLSKWLEGLFESQAGKVGVYMEHFKKIQKSETDEPPPQKEL